MPRQETEGKEEERGEGERGRERGGIEESKRH